MLSLALSSKLFPRGRLLQLHQLHKHKKNHPETTRTAYMQHKVAQSSPDTGACTPCCQHLPMDTLYILTVIMLES